MNFDEAKNTENGDKAGQFGSTGLREKSGISMNDVSDNEYWNYCDNCGTRLESFRCRYVCPKCGFFHSCSEP